MFDYIYYCLFVLYIDRIKLGKFIHPVGIIGKMISYSL